MDDAQLDQLIRDIYVRVCRDSRFSMSVEQAARLTAAVCKTHPLKVWVCLGQSNMERVADGTHPIVQDRA